MANPFKELDELEESEEPIKAPPFVKQKVMGSYGFIVNIAKVVEFIFGSFTNVFTGMVRLFDETPPSNPQNKIMGLGSFEALDENQKDKEDEKEEEHND